ncbi:uncharacterized protein LOC107613360 isoform X3 [Arachis ipaensis]|uniref:uncharacterized protein LOC107613360 isoform X3 n=1 Tax=Arachis ipaensis TaxID=130454 RepID=UPI000A2B06EE|nr:uncharacterized protein LOC107613360 isoform X3 [Arachis ipaensis]
MEPEPPIRFLPSASSLTLVSVSKIVLLFKLSKKNTKWGFLEGVRVSGAPPPRMVLVQQCIRDKGVLAVLCNYLPAGSSAPLHKLHGFGNLSETIKVGTSFLSFL